MSPQEIARLADRAQLDPLSVESLGPADLSPILEAPELVQELSRFAESSGLPAPGPGWMPPGLDAPAPSRPLEALELDETWHRACFRTPHSGTLDERGDADQAGDRGGGVLAGLHVALKDNLCTADAETSAGSAMLEGWRPAADAAVVRRLKEAGARIVGKTHLDEFAMGSRGTSSAFVRTPNPRDPRRVAGGSSSGSAAALALGRCEAALGSDTGGSVRLPAAHCGVVGLRPSSGTVSRRGLIAFACSMDLVGPMARDVDTLERVLRVIQVPDAGDARARHRVSPSRFAVQRAGILRSGPRDADDEQAIDEAVARLEALGVRCVDLHLPGLPILLKLYRQQTALEAASNLARFDGIRHGGRARSVGLGPEVRRRILLGTALGLRRDSPSSALTASLLEALRRSLHRLLDSVQCLLGPVRIATPPLLDDPDDPRREDDEDLHTVLASLAGLPALSLPAGLGPAGLPRAVQLIGPFGSDLGLLGIARELERGLGGPLPIARPAPLRRETLAPREAPPRDASVLRRPRGDDPIEDEAIAEPPLPDWRAVDDWETVIGLEVHVLLATGRKLFCPCRVDPRAPARSLVCPVCTGAPGALPVLDPAALRLGLRAALSLGMDIAPTLEFDRKHYFYPDLPKGYQITQQRRRLARGGRLEYALEGRPRQLEWDGLHLEEDAARIGESEGGLEVDDNRAGAPLIEVVCGPSLRSAEDAVAALAALRARLRWSGVGEGEMEHGGLRCDVNVSVRPRGAARTGPRVEIKNLNSRRAVRLAIAAERQRQIDAFRHPSEHPRLRSQTRGWDEASGRTLAQRDKEHSADYRFLPEDDLPAIAIPPAWIDEERARLGESATDRQRRYTEQWKLEPETAELLTRERSWSDRFESWLQVGLRASDAARWFQADLLGLARERALDPAELPLEPAGLLALQQEIDHGRLSLRSARRVLRRLVLEGMGLEEAIEAEGGRQVTDEAALRQLAQATLAACPEAVEDYRQGRRAALDSLMGRALRTSGGRADPRGLRRQLLALLESED